MEKSKVYFTKEITSDSLLKIYHTLGQELKGNVAVKISTGEPGGNNFLDPKLIAPLVGEVNGTIVENCTAYRGKRFEVADHWEAIKAHGFMDVAPCDILDEDGEMELKIKGGKHLKGVNYVGNHLEKYNSMLVLSHFKGHQMAGFGGALKNLSIGVASRNGKAWIHSWGNSTNPDSCWEFIENQDAFLESMAEACESVIDYFTPKNLVYINVANKLSIDCDCDSNPHKPEMRDIGLLASLDPVALDHACVSKVLTSTDDGKESLINRMRDRHGIHLIEYATALGIGTTHYDLINLDK